MLILDEFQHFIDRDSAKVLKTVSDWLKTLILDTNLPIILIGLPEAEQILQLNCHSQLSRRFANRCYLGPFVWQPDLKNYYVLPYLMQMRVWLAIFCV